jgi:hypothetical protein
MILWLLIATVIILACRFMPGPKCATYCKFRQLKFKVAKEKLKQLTIFKKGEEKFETIYFGDMTYQQLCRLYNNSRPYACTELIQEPWFLDARKALGDRIAEKQLLEE